MDHMTLPILIFISIPETILVILTGFSILGYKPSLKHIFTIGIFQSVFSFFIRSFSPVFGVHFLLQIVTFSLVVHLVMLFPFRISMLAVFLGVVVFSTVEAITAPALFTITEVSLSEVLNDFWLRFSFFIPEAIILTLIVFLIRRFDIKLPEHWLNYFGKNSFNKYYQLVSLFLIEMITISFISLSNFVQVKASSNLKILTSDPFIILGLLVVMFVITVFTIRRIVEINQDEIQAKAEIISLRNVGELINTIRSQRHNFSHDLQVAYGLLQVEAFQEAREYIQISMQEIAVTSEIVKTDNLGITALLQTKIGLAEGRKISLEIDVQTSLKELPIKSRDINIMLGNVIDNALEAVINLPLNQRKVKVVLSEDLDGYVFKVTNYGSLIEPELLEKIFEFGVSTKGKGRGMGLYSVKKLVQKYNGKVEGKSKAGIINFTIYLPLKK